jgi:hypothetical protein
MDSHVREAHISSKWAGGQTHLTWSCPRNSVLFVLRPFPFTVNQTPCCCTTCTLPQRSCSCENHPTLRQFPFRTSPCLPKGGALARLRRQASTWTPWMYERVKTLTSGKDLTSLQVDCFPSGYDFAHREHSSVITLNAGHLKASTGQQADMGAKTPLIVSRCCLNLVQSLSAKVVTTFVMVTAGCSLLLDSL